MYVCEKAWFIITNNFSKNQSNIFYLYKDSVFLKIHNSIYNKKYQTMTQMNDMYYKI